MKAKYFFFAKLGMWLVARRVMVDFEKEEVNALPSEHLRIDNKALTKSRLRPIVTRHSSRAHGKLKIIFHFKEGTINI